jgi:hypothetical protein
MPAIVNGEHPLTGDRIRAIVSQLGRLAPAAVVLCVGLALSPDPALAQRGAPPGLQPPGGRATAGTRCALALTAPPPPANVPAGSTFAIKWTGCAATMHVNLRLIDIAAWTVAWAVASNIPNSGTDSWAFPTTLLFSGPCGRQYQFYIAEVSNRTWNYGPPFTVTCAPAYDIKLVKQLWQPANHNYRITLFNLGRAIVGPAKITVLDSLPTGVKVTGGQGSDSHWTMSPSAPSTGPRTIVLTYSIPSGTVPTNTAAGFAWFTLQANAGTKKNCAMVTTLAVNNAVVTETNTTNNRGCAP